MQIPFSYWGTSYVYLDPLDYPDHGWSFWKRNASYSGSCARVQRSSDNTTQDFGFVNNYLDIAGIATFIGSSHGYIRIVYDQFGSVNLSDFYGGNTGYLPRIANSGTFITMSNGKVGIDFAAGTAEGYCAIFGGSGVTVCPNLGTTIITSFQSSNTGAQGHGGNDNGNSLHFITESGGTAGINVLWSYTEPQKIYVDGALALNGDPNPNNDVLRGDLYTEVVDNNIHLLGEIGGGWGFGTGHSIGGRGNGTPSNYYQGKWNEQLIWKENLTESKLLEIMDVLNIAQQAY